MKDDEGAHKTNDICLRVLLSLPVGLGISSLVMFYGIFFLRSVNRGVLVSAHLLLLSVLVFVALKRKSLERDISYLRHVQVSRSGWLVAIIVLLLFVFFQALPSFIMYPYGLWDAIAVWNLRARFILVADNWIRAFSPLMTTVKYPVLLPLIVVWGWLVEGQSGPLCPIMVSSAYASSMILFAFFSIRRYHGPRNAFIAVCFLISLPNFIEVVISQYADLTLACYNLMGIVSCFIGAKEKRKDYLILGELVLGLSLFTKNEGLLFFTLSNIVMFLYFVSRDKAALKMFWLSLAVALLPVCTLALFKTITPIANPLFVTHGLSFSFWVDKTREFFGFILSRSLQLNLYSLFSYVFLISSACFYKAMVKGARAIISLSLIVGFIGYVVAVFVRGEPINGQMIFTFPRLIFHLFPIGCFLLADLVFEDKNVVLHKEKSLPL